MVKVDHKKGFWLFCFVLCAALNLAAQEEDARIYRVEGADFSVTLSGSRTVLPASAAGEYGVSLERSGIVHTGPDTFLELQLVPSGTVIKLSENTSLVYNGIDEAGNFADLGLLYGKIRVVAGGGISRDGKYVPGTNSVVIRGGGVSVRMTGGDAGVDYVLEPESRASAPRPIFRVYAFRGGVELFPYGRDGAYFGGVESLAAREGECLSVDMSGSYTFAERNPLANDIRDYWTLHNFAASLSPLPMPDTEIAARAGTPAAIVYTPPPVEKIVYVEQPLPPAKLNNRNKNIALATGFVLTASSALVQGISYSQFDTINDNTARKIFQAGYAPLGLGLICILTGILYNPKEER